jgi:hypothetical protein
MGNKPLYAMITIGIMFATAVILVLFANPASSPSLLIVLGLIASSTPSLVAAIYSERASRDIRNGVVADKAREGAAQALEDSKHSDS